MELEQLIKSVIQSANSVRYELGRYFNESTYQSALLIDLHAKGILAEKEVPIDIYYHGVVVSELKVDILVDNQLILELKAKNELTVEHEKQLVSYLKASKYEHGLLINFGAERIEIKRKFKNYVPHKQD